MILAVDQGTSATKALVMCPERGVIGVGEAVVRQAHADAVARASEQAAEQERAHYARMLHDRILQTVETLATGG